MTHYNIFLSVKLVCDALHVGLGAVLVHVMEDGTEKPIAYVSRLLSKSKNEYSQIVKKNSTFSIWS